MIPEKEREALMRLTMCAREECIMCKYQGDCNFDFQYELATKNMNILAEALRKLSNSEIPNNSTISKMEQVEEPQMGDAKPIPLSNRVTHIKDEPKTQMKTQNSNLTFEKRTMRDCYNCERYETEDECIECHYEPKDECAKEYEELGLKELKELINADRKTENSSEIPNNCEYEDIFEYCPRCGMRILVSKPKDEPQTCEDCKHNGEKHAYDYACDKCTDMDKFQHEDEPQTDCAWK